ncbi:hypothetical protein [Photobacterium sp. 53610]|uniref:hypothetical protein n=1 Tax=Photobacterium sp. 53610 TaxID=3102789 RepID=UPI002ED9E69A
MKNKTPILILAAFVFAFAAESALAAPGGFSSSFKHARSSGSVAPFVIILAVPVIIILFICEFCNSSSQKSDLQQQFDCLIAKSNDFEWINLQPVFEQLMHEIYRYWQEMNKEALSKRMTNDYFHQQNERFLTPWQKEGVMNICRIESITSLQPYAIHVADLNDLKDGITVTASLNAMIKDYVVDKETGKITKASGQLKKGTEYAKKSSSYWTFTRIDGEWKLAEIAYRETDIQYIHTL